MNTLRLFQSNFSAILRSSELSYNKISLLLPTSIHLVTNSSLHISKVGQNSSRIGEIDAYDVKPVERKYKKPVDWLPFQWHRRPRYNVFEQSGDTIKDNTIDLSLPKPDFELSEELKDADEQVKQYFSLQTASIGEIKEVCKRHLLKRIQRHPNDFDSLEVKIALKTIQIRSLFQHRDRIGTWEKYISNVVLPILISKRNKLVKQLREMDNDRYLWLLEELKMYFKPSALGIEVVPYNKKWDLRRLTKEYCEKMVADKKAAYHEELKKQQAEFLEEKKQILAWIEQEEKALNVNQ